MGLPGKSAPSKSSLTVTGKSTESLVTLQSKTTDTYFSFLHRMQYARTRLITANHYAHVKRSLLFHQVTRKVLLGFFVKLTRFVQWNAIDTEALRLQFTGKCTALKRLVIKSPHHVTSKKHELVRQLLKPTEIFKALVNEDTLLRTHCCPWCFLGCANWETFFCGHKMFLNKNRNIFCVPDTKVVSATNLARAGKRGNICVGNNVSSFSSASRKEG